ncbi:MAG: ATP-binding protein [Sulfuricurvum sp.]|nr:ATP-binding protein [Sulfuricurvum sp.]
MNDLTLLYVGSNAQIIASFRRYTTKVIVVNAEEEAYSTLSQESFDGIIVENLVEIASSLSLLERVKMVKKSILTLLITLHPDQDSLLRAIDLGVNGVVTQPYDETKIAAICKKLFFTSLKNTQLLKKNLLLNQYKNALDASLNISKTDTEGKIIYVNEKFCQLAEYSASEIIGKTHRLFKHPETSKKQMETLWNTIQSKKVWHDTIVNRTKTGKSFYSDTFVIPILDEHNTIIEYMDMRIDVTALHERQRYMQQVLDAQSTMIVVFEKISIHRCNQRFLDFFNLDSLEAFLRIHKCLCDILIKAPDCFTTESFRAWLQSPTNTRDIKIAMMNTDNQVRIFKVSKTILENPEGSIEAIVSFTDITEIENYLYTLQAKINEATEAIRGQQQQLIAQSRAAALGEMFDNIAHQWRQPIGAINNTIINAEFALELGGMSQEEILKTFEQISTYTEFLSKTIDDFRNFSNPDKEKTHFCLHESITQTIGIIQGAYEMNQIHLTYEPDSAFTAFKVYGPQGELSQVILNILSNARDALKEKQITSGEVRIDLSGTEDTVTISIADNAGGIPETVLPKIFDPYFSTKNKAQGTGIGLYMSKIIIEKHYSGKLEAHNEEKGAVFSITLPIEKNV